MTIKLTFVSDDGAAQVVQTQSGRSVMQAALEHGVAGITAECNGNAACATCHVIFDDAVAAQLPEMQDHENDMLDFAATPRQAGSRLSCQIPVTEKLDNAFITLPKEQ